MKYCGKCGEKVSSEDRFCNKCGEKILKSNPQKNNLNKDNNLRKKLFDFSDNKGFFETFLWYVFLMIIVLPLYLYYDDSSLNLSYFINGGMTGILLASLVVLRRWKINLKTILSIIIGSLLGYLFGLHIGLILVFYILMTNNEDVEIPYIFSDAINGVIIQGFVYYLIGNAISAGGLLIADEGGTYYLLWGLIVYGIYLIFKGMFYYVFPGQLENLINKSSANAENTDSNAVEAKPVRSYFKDMFKTLFIILLIIVVLALIVMFFNS